MCVYVCVCFVHDSVCLCEPCIWNTSTCTHFFTHNYETCLFCTLSTTHPSVPWSGCVIHITHSLQHTHLCPGLGVLSTLHTLTHQFVLKPDKVGVRIVSISHEGGGVAIRQPRLHPLHFLPQLYKIKLINILPKPTIEQTLKMQHFFGTEEKHILQ